MASIELPPYKDSMLSMFVSTTRVKPKPPPPSTSLAGQTAMITGSNIGIGLACARVFLGLSLSHLIMAVRSIEKGEAAAAPLRKAFPKIKIDVWALDMLSYESIQAFVSRLATVPRLDIAILNAGLTKNESAINQATGHEEVFQVNYLSTALLAFLLLPIIRGEGKSSPGRLTLVSSGLGLKSAFPNRDAVPLMPSFDKEWKGMAAAQERYSVTKTMVMMLVLKLSECVSADDVIINAVEPGFVGGTSLNQNAAAFQRVTVKVMHKLFSRTPEEGAWTYVDAVAVKGKESHGCFIFDWEISG
jgi:NAD(P)-dependent dehydrogenase (short-subunit alcohol dehydrogenase family)